MAELVERVLNGDRRALARLLTYVENDREGVDQALAALFPHTGRAWVVGITGAPGTGKSTLVNELAKVYRAQDLTVGILAVDPTSPFSGGALLGDRIRMRDLSGDSGVFIRSMATRGSLGGLARATRDAIRLMDAAGFDLVLVETVGAGQNEVDIVRTADTTVVVEAPGMGDEVQAIKAGILEIADVLVVNKADRQGVNHTVRALRMMLELGHPASHSQIAAHHGRLLAVQATVGGDDHAPLWIPPIVQTVASEGKGIDEIVAAIDAHRRFLESSNLRGSVERQHIEIELYERLRDSLMARLLRDVPTSTLSDVIEQIRAREIDPQSAVQQILAQV
ncbi:MAG: methylmalonyl Co-A mutase-associated GTPase MeaB [Anaerolineae bacterium]|nr:methylmalonyl Co-A mutase-associated GTPase MeaB [Anaerolineae bacterium]